ncbi:hypothetical protein [Comamonas thiooxydans]|uniref:hypothetical protein n=1 Tax=Comamonas thiooxydans TaxID=363952 RepID=UPI0006A9226F|nr:hypothetical protein [Comamonas thiooxydans]CUA97941.1 hypothetical protein Ga0061062_106217 [Comamonas thiooxydans]
MKQLTALEEILLRFAGVKSITESTIRTFKRHIHNEESRFVIGNYLLVNARSFIEVFDAFKKLPRTAEIDLAIIANEPFAQKIQSWNGLRDLRNQVLAHGFDDRKNDTIANIERFYSSDTVPTTDWEIIIMGECAAFACGCIMTSFDAELRSAQSKLNEFEPKTNGAKSKEEYISEMQRLVKEHLSIDRRNAENLETALRVHVIQWAENLMTK